VPNHNPNNVVTATQAFTLILEDACNQFEVLQGLLSGEIRVVGAHPGSEVRITKHAGVIRMALAKSFLFNASRANRICKNNKAALAIDGQERKRFLSATKCLAAVRDVIEHGYDGNLQSKKRRPTMHQHNEAFVDETSLCVAGLTKILMGPLNLHDVYTVVARMRDFTRAVQSAPSSHPA